MKVAIPIFMKTACEYLSSLAGRYSLFSLEEYGIESSTEKFNCVYFLNRLPLSKQRLNVFVRSAMMSIRSLYF